MKIQNLYAKLFLLLLAVLVLSNESSSQTPYTLKSSKLTIDGTSSLHDWTSETTKLEWTGSFVVADKKIKDAKGVQVRIPVTSIKSTKGKIMDNKTYEAFNYEKYPTILYKLTSITINNNVLKATGTLTMAGTTKSFDMNVSSKLLAAGEIQLTGSQKINMKDYKMEPPTAVMGTIKVGEEVTVKFDLTVTPNTNL